MAKKRCTELRECCFQEGATPVVDREAGIIRGVKILGKVSKNNREYSERALHEAAEKYQGMNVNTNHPNRKEPGVERPVQDGFGWLESVSVKPDGVYGDLHFLKTHSMAGPLCEAAERKPDRFGLSHNASGVTKIVGGKTVVESIESVRSVDIVQNPATNNSLFESEDVPVTKRTLKQVIESLPVGKPRQALTSLMEDAELPMVGPELPIDEMPVEDGGSPTADQAAKDAFKAAINAILDDESISWADTQSRVTELIKTMASMAGGDPEVPTPEGGDPVPESVQEELKQLKKQLADERLDKSVRELLESSKVKVTPSRVVALKAVPGEKDRKSLLEDWSKADGPQKSNRPLSSPSIVNLQESQPTGYKPPRGASEMAKAYR